MNFWILQRAAKQILFCPTPFHDWHFVCVCVCVCLQSIKICVTKLPLYGEASLQEGETDRILCYCKKPDDIMSRNLLKNPCGEEDLESWELVENGGNGWIVEDMPGDCGPDFENDEVKKYFVTSFEWCSKKQVIDLLAEDYTTDELNTEPEVTVEDWYCSRTDCGCEYRLAVNLLDDNHEVMEYFKPELVLLDPENDDCSWKKMSYTFSGYGPGLRFISFEHGGTRSQVAAALPCPAEGILHLFQPGGFLLMRSFRRQEVGSPALERGLRVLLSTTLTTSVPKLAQQAPVNQKTVFASETAEDCYKPADIMPRNLLKNPCGEENLAFWRLMENGGDGWKVEDMPAGCGQDFVDEKVKKYFATSFKLCLKRQVIDLCDEGYLSEELDAQPTVTVEDWYCSQTDCGCEYRLTVSLLDENRKVIQKYQPAIVTINPKIQDGSWKQTKHTFSGYGPGLRFISFEHGGKDTKYWKGWYGVRVTGSSVTINL
ncbi:hypothetical protein OJAV_G00042740 [Oryzias javanicus]|uniref:FBA domain-containing protein n=1 Tax=Oryzias javanicus TaxID=123683 RepID=A0A437DBU5_ORYJA|nr:hypothetical protein OJAV_G00042740 [Oryzias javanicus]